MRKKLSCMAILVISLSYKGQVGIGTATPKSTLDITAKNATGSSTSTDGILIPRVDRQRALSMTSVEPSTLIYVNNISTGTATGQASNIDAAGFYYFDGSTSKWAKLSTDTNTNIYNTDGVLTNDRVVGLGNNSLTFRNGVEANLFFERSRTGNLQSGQNVANLYTSGSAGGSIQTLSGIRTYYRGDGTNNKSSMALSVNGENSNNLVLSDNNNIGIGTATPKSTLDITAKNATGSSTSTDGILIPRVDRQRALSMTSVEPSTLIYVNNISTGTATGQASDVDAVGFYYFDGSTSKWKKLSTDTNTNIYNTDGVLTSSRVVGLDNNSLTFRNGVEANLFFERSHTGNLQSGQNVANLYTSGSAGGSIQTLSGIRTYYRGDGTNNKSSMTFSVNGENSNNLVLSDNNNIGIGTTTPDTKLTISTPDSGFGIKHTNGIIDLKSFIGGGRAYFGTTTSNDLSLMTGNTARATITKDGDVGIGTDTPKASLEINSTNSGILLPRLTNSQRDMIPSGKAQQGTIIYNYDAAKLQVNIGTDSNRVWTNLDTSSTTLNTTVAFQGNVNNPQTLSYTDSYMAINFPNTIFDNTVGGFITKLNDNNTIRLAGGKTYRIDANLGRLQSSDKAHTWCQIVEGSTVLASVSILPSGHSSNWNTFNTMQAYLTVGNGSQKDIQVKCSKTQSGTVQIPDGIAQVLTITMMN